MKQNKMIGKGKNKAVKTKRKSAERVFIVNESYEGKKKLSDIFADLVYSAYSKQEPKIMGITLTKAVIHPNEPVKGIITEFKRIRIRNLREAERLPVFSRFKTDYNKKYNGD